MAKKKSHRSGSGSSAHRTAQSSSRQNTPQRTSAPGQQRQTQPANRQPKSPRYSEKYNNRPNPYTGYLPPGADTSSGAYHPEAIDHERVAQLERDNEARIRRAAQANAQQAQSEKAQPVSNARGQEMQETVAPVQPQKPQVQSDANSQNASSTSGENRQMTASQRSRKKKRNHRDRRAAVEEARMKRINEDSGRSSEHLREIIESAATESATDALIANLTAPQKQEEQSAPAAVPEIQPQVRLSPDGTPLVAVPSFDKDGNPITAWMPVAQPVQEEKKESGVILAVTDIPDISEDELPQIPVRPTRRWNPPAKKNEQAEPQSEEKTSAAVVAPIIIENVSLAEDNAAQENEPCQSPADESTENTAQEAEAAAAKSLEEVLEEVALSDEPQEVEAEPSDAEDAAQESETEETEEQLPEEAEEITEDEPADSEEPDEEEGEASADDTADFDDTADSELETEEAAEEEKSEELSEGTEPEAGEGPSASEEEEPEEETEADSEQEEETEEDSEEATAESDEPQDDEAEEENDEEEDDVKTYVVGSLSHREEPEEADSLDDAQAQWEETARSENVTHRKNFETRISEDFTDVATTVEQDETLFIRKPRPESATTVFTVPASGRAGEFFDDDDDFFEQWLEEGDEMIIKDRRQRRRVSAIVGAVTMIFAIIGFVMVINMLISRIPTSNTESTYAQYEKFIAPIVLTDPSPFENLEGAQQNLLVDAAVVSLIDGSYSVSDSDSTYTTEQTEDAIRLVIPAQDVVTAGRRLFGPTFEIKTESLYTIEQEELYYYSELDNSFHVSVTGLTGITPDVNRVIKNGDMITLEVGYLSETEKADIGQDYYKEMDYILTVKSDGSYYVSAIRETAQ